MIFSDVINVITDSWIVSRILCPFRVIYNLNTDWSFTYSFGWQEVSSLFPWLLVLPITHLFSVCRPKTGVSETKSQVSRKSIETSSGERGVRVVEYTRGCIHTYKLYVYGQTVYPFDFKTSSTGWTQGTPDHYWTSTYVTDYVEHKTKRIQSSGPDLVLTRPRTSTSSIRL